ncbi:class IV adenylate cyclase [Candidatus Woesearchaeota archaeon]|jgi:adenylate cyclase, class 2|nr:class IV adenylate cyclase [Candidatus Woesearchaeota archaeon]MBT3536986.1 class IV adenylate cyclase [Candidatus Woesearchaeota archaeon]MBT4697596.1 class IV adenylate cyclase [Candidatus Woesearchaeota archaeon]MBT4717710.1 class IV adenylate cyclase [Candidatus Woesearchaeota archaeon]MBT7106704.1 class IV adenylate cyclase [Candidatus Woesearchaeota archaeon]
MASDNIEVEIKIPVSEMFFSSVKAVLKQKAKFAGVSNQTDEYFTLSNRDFVEPDYPFEWLSIRKRGNKAILNYKHFHPENVEITTHCDEYESEVANPEMIKKMFSELNIKSLIVVNKKRETYVFNDEFEIALDEVAELGFFVEIEALKDFGGVSLTRQKLEEFAKQLGIDHIDTDKRGYPYLLLEKKGLIK